MPDEDQKVFLQITILIFPCSRVSDTMYFEVRRGHDSATVLAPVPGCNPKTPDLHVFF
jgi:hypothetical protein